ncbi:imidazole glycerol phosphate synthase subunit HisH [Branchiibius hedensis]|uniref:Imidazole glycerol phosphate synthase subunit HisH n=1 Tax=Branchiibius hedensis TaxID=672460 RepID=A0A2Y8ZV93_9MICO|nr:imidazole glycerol phosphate synthase subunit HisH [Branchiibius hedensis]PWJ25416.1 imidazole glycerol phosphate synthase subunit HisH [Branchiibius hedensis]SSA34229.1 imidazole glycerol phosphate synthase subunit hisH [Branchiibius hedensis]
MTATVAVLDYGSGNVHSVLRMLTRVGAQVTLTADPDVVRRADGLYVPGVGNFHACMRGLLEVGGDALIRQRLADTAPVLGVCVGHQILFDGSTEPAGEPLPGLGVVNGLVSRLQAPVVPHMGWSLVTDAAELPMFDGIADQRFYFVHSYAATDSSAAQIAHAEHGQPFVAALQDGALWGTQFHPEKSGDAGAALLRNWIQSFN